MLSLLSDVSDEGSAGKLVPGAVQRALHGPRAAGVHLRQAHTRIQVSAPRRPGHPPQVVRLRGPPRQARGALREPGTYT